MNPLHLSASGVGRLAPFDHDLPGGTVAIVGPNGAGKSTWLGCIELGLFADGSRDLAPLLGPGQERLELALTFEHAGDTYRVRRSCRLVGAGGQPKCTLDFERVVGVEGSLASLAAAERFRRPDHEYVSLSRETTDATQALIVETIGISRRTFNASAHLAQGNAAAFPDAKPAERKATIGDILDPRGRWAKLAEKASADRKKAEQEIAAATVRAETLTELASQLPDTLATLDSLTVQEATARLAVGDAEAALESAQAAVSANAAAAERVKALVAQVESASREHVRLVEEHRQARMADVALDDAREEYERVEADAARVAELEHAAEAASAARDAAAHATRHKESLLEDARREANEAKRLHTEAETLAAKVQALGDQRHGVDTGTAETCDKCGSVLGAEERATLLASLAAESTAAWVLAITTSEQADEADARAAALIEESRLVEIPAVPADPGPELAHARRAQQQAAVLRERIAALAAKAALEESLHAEALAAEFDLGEARDALALAREGVKDEPALIDAAHRRRYDVQQARAALDQYTAGLAVARTRAEQQKQAAADLTVLRKDTAALHARLDLLRLAERAYGRDGIPTLIVEGVIPVIEAEANRILEQLPTVDGVTFRVELRTQREKRDGALRETLDVVVFDPDGARPYETFSGGERARLNIALRLALARLLAHRRGAEIRLLALDELEFLDTTGQQALAEVLKTIEGDYSKIYLVSHSPLLQDAFESQVRVVKQGGVSRVVVGDVDREAVAA